MGRQTLGKESSAGLIPRWISPKGYGNAKETSLTLIFKGKKTLKVGF